MKGTRLNFRRHPHSVVGNFQDAEIIPARNSEMDPTFPRTGLDSVDGKIVDHPMNLVRIGQNLDCAIQIMGDFKLACVFPLVDGIDDFLRDTG